MDYCVLLLLLCTVLAASAWTVPQHPPPAPHRTPMRFARLAPYHRHHRIPAPVDEASPTEAQRPKRDFDDHESHDHGYHRDRDHHDRKGTTGPVHTFIKTDKNANYKWGVRHHVGNKFAS